MNWGLDIQTIQYFGAWCLVYARLFMVHGSRRMAVDVERLRAIEILQSEIVSTERDIKDRQREIEELETAYNADIERFEMLRDVVKLRQTLRTEQ